ncbi:hypothetical protein IQ247_20770 [Plectonema cf. radiosum LEGE 06105]|uniref:Uncharacterized protein n=1 Tax=Plectonema cf. radiosum LEGE 06105 TaxID=945769 RepID=A0A8J7K577_9CYAN|nr:hypothetical protein [Plectonema radiosum]MBE9215067.1 hypothetical protein [Plectonema cf. radiosum LEGE 06105]
MQNKLYIPTKNPQKLSSTLSHTPVQGMFESRSLIVQHKQGDKRQPNLKKSLIQAERYGHHLQHRHSNQQNKIQQLPIQQKTLVIGGPANKKKKTTTLNQIADPNHPSHDQYIGNAYAYVSSQQDQQDDNRPENIINGNNSQAVNNTAHHRQNPPLRIPDKFGAREAKGWKNLPKRMLGRLKGTPKHGSRKSYQPQGAETQYLNNLNQNEPLNITAHGTASGKIGGYKPKKLANLLMKTGLQPGQQGTIDLRACQSAVPGKNHKKSPALKLENELRKRGVNMNVRGFEHLIQANQLDEIKPNNTTQPANLVDTSLERKRLAFIKNATS